MRTGYCKLQNQRRALREFRVGVGTPSYVVADKKLRCFETAPRRLEWGVCLRMVPIVYENVKVLWAGDSEHLR